MSITDRNIFTTTAMVDDLGLSQAIFQDDLVSVRYERVPNGFDLCIRSLHAVHWQVWKAKAQEIKTHFENTGLTVCDFNVSGNGNERAEITFFCGREQYSPPGSGEAGLLKDVTKGK